MAPPNALYMVQSEVSLMLTALKCTTRGLYRAHQKEDKKPIYLKFSQLQLLLNEVNSIHELEPLVYLTPFLDVIRSENTNEAITGLALTSVDKFLSYGLLDIAVKPNDCASDRFNSLSSIAIAAEAIADAGTQARFLGTDPRSAEVVLMKILHVLQTLLLVPAGNLISDEAVEEILKSCFRICFEVKLSELLRRTAESCLASIIQLFFSRLPTLSGFWSEACVESKLDSNLSNLKTDTIEDTNVSSQDKNVYNTDNCLEKAQSVSAYFMHEDGEDLCVVQTSDHDLISSTDKHDYESSIEAVQLDHLMFESTEAESAEKNEMKSATDSVENQSTINGAVNDKSSPDYSKVTTVSNQTVNIPKPYGIIVVYSLLNYLIAALNPSNSTVVGSLTSSNANHLAWIRTSALGLITIALETGSDTIANCPQLRTIIQGDLSKHLMFLLYSESVWQFAATLRVCFLLFESMRSHLKLQMEIYLQRLTAISSLDNELTSYERREIALDAVVRLFLVPGLATELFFNYDCDPYCSNLFEDITKMLAKNAFPVERLMGTHLLALDALLAVLNTIEIHCVANPHQIESSRKLRLNRHPIDPLNHQLLSREQLNWAKDQKKLLILGSDQFNIKPKKGIDFLVEHGILKNPLDLDELAVFLRENPRLDKRMIGEYLSNRDNVDILAAFVKQFNFENVQIDEALRVYLEAFRLPGEAPLIQRLLEQFATIWHESNHEPFADADAAFTLAYAILMLNTDQHNPNSKKQNVPMRMEDFKKNLSGTNNDEDFDPKLIDTIFTNIHNNEIVMPSEQTGLVRENYLWKCLLRRSNTKQGQFVHVQTGTLDADLFELIWGPTVSALSFIFDKTLDPEVQFKVVNGFNRCAFIAAHYGMSDVLDNLVISLCKFTTLLTTADNPLILPATLGRNAKASLALRLVFLIASRHADILRYGWHSLFDCLLQLFRANLLPDSLLESDDFLTDSKRVRITIKGCLPIGLSVNKTGRRKGQKGDSFVNRDLGVFSSFYQYLTTGTHWADSGDEYDGYDDCSVDNQPTVQPDTYSSKLESFNLTEYDFVSMLKHNQMDDQSASRIAMDTVASCHIGQLIEDSKCLVDASLNELIKTLLHLIRGDSCSISPSTFNNLDSFGFVDDPPGQHATSKNDHSSSFDETTLPSYYHSFAINGSPRAPDEYRIFCFELLIRVLVHNRDRVTSLWPSVRVHIIDLLINSGQKLQSIFVERIFVGLLRLATCLLRRHEMTSQIFICIHWLLFNWGEQFMYTAISSPQTLPTEPCVVHPSMINRSVPTSNRKSDNRLSSPVSIVGSCSKVSLQIIAGLMNLLKNHMVDLPDTNADWKLIFKLLEVCGAGRRARPVPLNNAALDRSKRKHRTDKIIYGSSDALGLIDPNADDSYHHVESDRGYTSDSETPKTTYEKLLEDHSKGTFACHLTNVQPSLSLLESSVDARTHAAVFTSSSLSHSLNHNEVVNIGTRDPMSLVQAAECLAFIVRDPAYISPENFGYCVQTLQVFVESCLVKPSTKSYHSRLPIGSQQSADSNKYDAMWNRHDSTILDTEMQLELHEMAVISPTTSAVALQLLDLIYTLFTRATSIHTEWMRMTNTSTAATSESTDGGGNDVDQPDMAYMWTHFWCPLLQTTARLCSDVRREVRTDALTYLQRSLLSPTLHAIGGLQWEECFEKVLFPLLSGFLKSIAAEEAWAVAISGHKPKSIQTNSLFSPSSECADSRMRAIPLLTKVFLQHLRPLYNLKTFDTLWIKVLTYMEHYMIASSSDSLTDAVRESLKNVLLVMCTGTQDISPILVKDVSVESDASRFWQLTENKLSSFLPDLLEQLFPTQKPPQLPPPIEELSLELEQNEVIEQTVQND